MRQGKKLWGTPKAKRVRWTKIKGKRVKYKKKE